MDDYSEAQAIINKMAEVKMTMNAHKGRIEDCDTDDIKVMLYGEVEELEGALEEDDITHIIEEAADVQNFLLALVQQQLNRYRGRK